MLCGCIFPCIDIVVTNIIVKELRDTPSLRHMKPHLSLFKDTYTVDLWDVGHSIHDVLRECDIQDSAIVDKLTGLSSVYYNIATLYGSGVLKSCIVLCAVVDQVYWDVVLCSVLY